MNQKKEQGEQKVLKQTRNFLAIVIICFFLHTQLVLGQDDTIPTVQDISQNSQTEFAQNELKVKDLDIEPINTQKVKESVIPDPSKEWKKVVGLFLKTMAAVGFCTILLYLILVIVKRFYSDAFAKTDNEDLEDFDLSTPNNRHDALKSFLNRTK